MSRQFIRIHCGGIFVSDAREENKVYVGGTEIELDVNLKHLTLEALGCYIQGVMGFRQVHKMHFRPNGKNSNLATGLRLLFEGSFEILVECIKKDGFVDLYTEHKMTKHAVSGLLGISEKGEGIVDITEATIVKDAKGVDEICTNALVDGSCSSLNVGVRSKAEEVQLRAEDYEDIISELNLDDYLCSQFTMTQTDTAVLHAVEGVGAVSQEGINPADLHAVEGVRVVSQEGINPGNVHDVEGAGVLTQEGGNLGEVHEAAAENAAENETEVEASRVNMTIEEINEDDGGASIEFDGQHIEVEAIGEEFEEVDARDSDEEIVDCRWLSDDDEELQEARDLIRQFKKKKQKKFADGVSNDQSRRSHEVPNLLGDGEDSEYLQTDDSYSAVSNENSEDDHARRKKSRFPGFQPRAEKVAFSLGMRLTGPKQLNEALTRYQIQERRPIKYFRNTKTEVGAKCLKDNCPWKIFASFDSVTKRFLVKTLMDHHSCQILYKNSRVKASWLAKNYLYKYKCLATMRLRDLKELINEDLQLEVDFSKVARAKMRVVASLQGQAKEEFGMLWDYLGEIERSNPGSTTAMKVMRPLPEDLPIFERLYISFDCVKKGLLSGCRRVIGLDGCFLKGAIKGEILAAVGRDGNNQMFPVAWGLVDCEKRATWEWFMEKLQKDLYLEDGGGWTVITDQQKGLLDAVANILPNAEHRCCARHLYANWRKRHGRTEQLQKQFWMCAKTTNMPDFEANMNEMKKLTPSGFDDILSTHPRHWSRAYFNTEVKCDIVDNNLIEAFNGKIIEARTKNVITMLEDIRCLVMTRLHLNRDMAPKWLGRFGHRIRKKVPDSYVESAQCHGVWNGENGFEVLHKGDKYTVDLKNRICPCRKWDLTGIPCCHGICAILDLDKDPLDFVHECYSKERYLQAYSFMMQPMNGCKFWEKTGNDPPQPPPFKKMPGRPARNRRKEVGEIGASGYKRSRNVRIMTCRVCFKKGHNKKGCPVMKRRQQAAPQPENVQTHQPGTQESHVTQEHNIGGIVELQPEFGATNERNVSPPIENSNIEDLIDKLESPDRFSGKVFCPRRNQGSGRKYIPGFVSQPPAGYGVWNDPITGHIAVNPKRPSQRVTYVEGNMRTANEPEPSFMTERQKGFKKWGNQFITTAQLEEERQQKQSKKASKGKGKEKVGIQRKRGSDSNNIDDGKKRRTRSATRSATRSGKGIYIAPSQ